MRKSRVLLAGVAVAAAGAATSAFTASNTVPNSVAGYGQGTVTGATVTNISYVANGSDGTVVDAIRFTSTTNITTHTSTMTLKTTGGTAVVGSPYACAVTSPWAPGATPPSLVLTCDTSAASNAGVVRRFADFDAVGLTVVQ
ncbi:hypothetical protein E4P40_07615 [Blastococcus sp. CT_GayMR20]|uniref:hypothetical protein n=1 Tax=Blastococcus sp. CT_GayMR20 TaxID=2559609 RepID=UPI001073E8B3|nr:hypothetical protein [Blastococcus sp. CT_GayMR20]TFV90186.1 hypothetical protein E4P40_07470 [Blastococcus sp. CT_GayMR20]TFV90209.1 hypothetical protein E4P40_07615 [Blastococcus sp. CT_GayMR20]